MVGGHVAKGSGPNKKLAKRAAAENVLQVRKKQGATEAVLTNVCVVRGAFDTHKYPPNLVHFDPHNKDQSIRINEFS